MVVWSLLVRGLVVFVVGSRGQLSFFLALGSNDGRGLTEIAWAILLRIFWVLLLYSQDVDGGFATAGKDAATSCVLDAFEDPRLDSTLVNGNADHLGRQQQLQCSTGDVGQTLVVDNEQSFFEVVALHLVLKTHLQAAVEEQAKFVGGQ